MKRFYKEVSVAPEAQGWRVLLDGRAIKTAGGRAQVVATQALAQALAAEWDVQGEAIDKAMFVLRDLADYSIDVTAGDARAALIDEIAAYADSDTLCYRANPDEPLFQRQQQVWEPMLVRAEQGYAVRFIRISGLMHRAQPSETLARMHQEVAAQDASGLAALRMLTSLTASLVLALAALEPDAKAQALWTAANLEEDWQAEYWGSDAEAQALRQIRYEAFQLAMRFAKLARGG